MKQWPVPVSLALLRAVRRHEPKPGDRELFFDTFCAATPEEAIKEGMITVFGDHFGWHQIGRWRDYLGQFDAALVDMVRSALEQREEEVRPNIRRRQSLAVEARTGKVF